LSPIRKLEGGGNLVVVALLRQYGAGRTGADTIAGRKALVAQGVAGADFDPAGRVVREPAAVDVVNDDIAVEKFF